MGYSEYLQSEHWQKIRAERLKIDDYKCQKCGRPLDLQVHHLNYDNLGNEDIYSDLITLCKYCHHRIEQQKNDYKNDHHNARKRHHDLINEFIALYEDEDLSNIGKGKLNLCNQNVSRPLLQKFLLSNGDISSPHGVSDVIAYFAKKRHQIILDFVEKGYPEYICYQRTLFSKSMIHKVYQRPETYKNEI